MDYQFENLGPERFQEFCQALLARLYPDVQCLPVAQPDGGRDAFIFTGEVSPHVEATRKFIICQVKFVRKPLAETDPHKWLIGIIEGEAPKVAKLIQKGADGYYLLTNVPGTAHLKVGSIDKANEILSNNFQISSQCWWRDDLNHNQQPTLMEMTEHAPEMVTVIDLRHPLCGQSFQLLGIAMKNKFGRCCVVLDHAGRERNLPIAVTDQSPDPLVIAPFPLTVATITSLIHVYSHICPRPGTDKGVGEEDGREIPQ